MAILYAEMAKSADASDLKSADSNIVRVQVPFSAPVRKWTSETFTHGKLQLSSEHR